MASSAGEKEDTVGAPVEVSGTMALTIPGLSVASIILLIALIGFIYYRRKALA